jgi:transketolase
MYGQALLDIATDNERVVALSADLGNSSGLDRFKKTFPDRFINVGVAEQNLVGVAAGVAREGFIPFASSFAPFISMRASEQVRMNLGYMNLNVKAVGIGSGLAMGFLGNSHFGLEDVAVLRSIPGITVVCPADCAEVVKTVRAAAQFEGPMYIRLTGSVNCPVVYAGDYDFQVGKAVRMREGADLAMIATGSMVAASLAAAQELENEGISAGVFNFHTLKPLDVDLLREICNSFPSVVTVEEHSVIGGLGSAVAEATASWQVRPRHLIVGLSDEWGDTGDYGYLMEQHQLTPKDLSRRVNQFIS